MKKIIVFLCLCVCAGVSAMATEQEELPCNGGAIVTAKDGTKFCHSNKEMNWWSAFAWCESQGRKLADFTTMCGNVSQSPGGTVGQCPNLQNVVTYCVWSSLASGSNYAIVVCSDGAVYAGNRATGNGRNTYYVLCDEDK